MARRITGHHHGDPVQFPEIIPFYRQEVGLTLVVRVLVFPILVLVILWLAGSLARKMGSQVALKSLSWIYASIILAGDAVLLLLGNVPVIQEVFTRGQLGILQAMLFLELIIPIPFCLFVIRPRMREVYKDSRFLYSLPKQALLYIVAVALYLLAIGVVEAILGVGPFLE